MTTQNDQSKGRQIKQKNALNKRLEAISWALFLIMIAVLWLMPEGRMPKDAWLIGVGLIMLGLNGTRYLYGIKLSGFTIVLGIVALAYGTSSSLGVSLPFFPILFLIIGASIILFPLIKKKRS